MRLIIFFIGFYLLSIPCLYAQTVDSIHYSSDTIAVVKKVYHLDSATIARNRFLKDSIKIAQDSITFLLIKQLPLNRSNLFLDSLLKEYLITNRFLLPDGYSKIFKTARFGSSILKAKREVWELAIIGFIIFSFGLLYKFFSKEIYLLLLGLFNFKSNNLTNKEGNLLFSWQSLGLFILFSASSAMVIFQLLKYLGMAFSVKGLLFYGYLVLAILLFYVIKFIILKILASVFDLNSMVNDYLKQLQLSCFSILLFLMPFILVLSLIGSKNFIVAFYLVVTIVLLIYAIRYLKYIIYYLPNYTFSKTYLILYICTLEICPLFFIIRALNIA